MKIALATTKTTEDEQAERAKRRRARLDEFMKSGEVSMADICILILFETLTPEHAQIIANKRGITVEQVQTFAANKADQLKGEILSKVFDRWFNESS